MSFDHWLTTEPDREPAPPVKYRCLDCAWRGLALAAFDHHQIAHHRIVLPNGLQAIFACCGKARCASCGRYVAKGTATCRACELPDENPREWDEDDGLSYGDPRDEREERLRR